MEVTAVVLARDCERTISRALESAIAVSDSVLVIDTGSSDQTVPIARSFGDIQVHESEWSDSFSHARNLAFEFACEGLIFYLDSDEWIERGDQPEARATLRSLAGEQGCWSPVIKDIDDAKPVATGVPRIVSTGSRYRFRYRVHERLFAGNREVYPPPVRVAIRHDGYSRENLRRFDKKNRNLRLLKLSLDESPGDAHLLFFLLRDGLDTRTQEQNLALLEEIDESCLKVKRHNSRNLRLLSRKVLLMHEWFRAGVQPVAIELAESILQFHENDPDAAYVIGVSDLLNARRSIRASMVRIAHVRNAIEDHPPWSMSGTNTYIDALISEHLRALGDPRYAEFIEDLPRTWADPYFEGSLLRGGY